MTTKTKSKNLDFEINLLPFISVLAVCLSFLLLTSSWTQIGTLSLSQALGTEGAGVAKNPQAIWVQFENDGSANVSVKQGDQLKDSLKFINLRAKKSRLDILHLENFAKKIKAELPGLNIALILPAPRSSYEDIVAAMNVFKKLDIKDVGIAPL